MLIQLANILQCSMICCVYSCIYDISNNILRYILWHMTIFQTIDHDILRYIKRYVTISYDIWRYPKRYIATFTRSYDISNDILRYLKILQFANDMLRYNTIYNDIAAQGPEFSSKITFHDGSCSRWVVEVTKFAREARIHHVNYVSESIIW